MQVKKGGGWEKFHKKQLISHHVVGHVDYQLISFVSYILFFFQKEKERLG